MDRETAGGGCRSPQNPKKPREARRHRPVATAAKPLTGCGTASSQSTRATRIAVLCNSANRLEYSSSSPYRLARIKLRPASCQYALDCDILALPGFNTIYGIFMSTNYNFFFRNLSSKNSDVKCALPRVIS